MASRSDRASRSDGVSLSDMEEYLSDSAAPIRPVSAPHNDTWSCPESSRCSAYRLVPAGHLPPPDCPKSPRETEILRTPSGFSILTDEYLTFQTVSPNEAGRIYAYYEPQKGFPAHCFSMFFVVVSIIKNQFRKQLTLEIQFVRETAGFHG